MPCLLIFGCVGPLALIAAVFGWVALGMGAASGRRGAWALVPVPVLAEVVAWGFVRSSAFVPEPFELVSHVYRLRGVPILVERSWIEADAIGWSSINPTYPLWAAVLAVGVAIAGLGVGVGRGRERPGFDGMRWAPVACNGPALVLGVSLAVIVAIRAVGWAPRVGAVEGIALAATVVAGWFGSRGIRARWVRIGPDAVVVEGRGGRLRRLALADLEEVRAERIGWLGVERRRLILRTRQDVVAVRASGTRPEDLRAVVAALRVSTSCSNR